MLLEGPTLPIVVAVLALWLAGLTSWLYKIASHYNSLVKRSDKKTLVDILKDLLSQVSTVQGQINQHEKKRAEAEKEAKGYIQKVGVVRFNPFGDTGGNQSFAAALLDGQESGIVILSLHGREGTRVYIKSVTNGKSPHDLSREEKQAITQAK